jgi:hypothetical protein
LLAVYYFVFVRHPLKIQKLGFGCVAGRIANALIRWARFAKARQGELQLAMRELQMALRELQMALRELQMALREL